MLQPRENWKRENHTMRMRKTQIGISMLREANENKSATSVNVIRNQMENAASLFCERLFCLPAFFFALFLARDEKKHRTWKVSDSRLLWMQADTSFSFCLIFFSLLSLHSARFHLKVGFRHTHQKKESISPSASAHNTCENDKLWQNRVKILISFYNHVPFTFCICFLFILSLILNLLAKVHVASSLSYLISLLQKIYIQFS